MNTEFVPVRAPAQVETVAALARDIWYEYYVALIGRAQVDYMVAKFQSVAAMSRQIEAGYEYFLVQRDGQDVGYIGFQDQGPAGLFLSKFYLQRAVRGSGTGRLAMAFLERLARQRGLKLIWLTVNKGNPAVNAYERLGFRIAADLVMDIGGGFVMDDFRMEKPLS
jgi:GNAT superfamily N-acetyltransferase